MTQVEAGRSPVGSTRRRTPSTTPRTTSSSTWTRCCRAATQGGRYYSVFSGSEFVGYFEFRKEGEEVVLGLGMHPDRCGHGEGLKFVEAGMAFARHLFQADQFALWVAAFNERATRVYERAGFEVVRQIDEPTNGAVYQFIQMRCTQRV